MKGRLLVTGILVLAGAAIATVAALDSGHQSRVLRVCADPNNLPFTNRAGAGFENRMAELLARDLDARVEYTWWAQRRGFIRNTLRSGECDLVMGLASSVELAATTKPYYRSTYVFVTRRDRGLQIESLDDSALRSLRVGVQLIGDDFANSPPAHALSRRGIVRNVVGYSVYGDYSLPNPPARIVEAVSRGDIDVAVAWGPIAGFFASRDSVLLALSRVSPAIDIPFLPFVFDVSMGVRREDTLFRAELDRWIELRRADIRGILRDYSIVTVDDSR